MSLPEIVGLVVAVVGIFSSAVWGIWWLVTIAIQKGDAQANAILNKVDHITGGIIDSIKALDSASIERHEQYQRHIDSRFESVSHTMSRHLDYTKSVEEKAEEAIKGVEHIKGQLTYFQSRSAK